MAKKQTKKKAPAKKEEPKNLVGRPPKFKDPEELKAKIDEYFEEKVGVDIIKDSKGNICTDKRGSPVYEVRPPTISGLAHFLGFESRQSLYDYKDKQEFSYTIKEATLKIEEFAETQLFIGNCTGAIFWLKNKGWKDNMSHEIGGRNGEPIIFEVVSAKNKDTGKT